MNEQPALFTQRITCDCGEDVFLISTLYVEHVVIECRKCGAQFTIFGERADELFAKTILKREKARRTQLTVGELLEIKLRNFEAQLGERGESAALLLGEYINSLFDAVVESVDELIINRLRDRFVEVAKKRGVEASGPDLQREIIEAGESALENSGYTLADDEGD